MAIRVALLHRTTYRFDRLVNLSPHEVRLRPATAAAEAQPSVALTASLRDAMDLITKQGGEPVKGPSDGMTSQVRIFLLPTENVKVRELRN